MDDLSKEQKQKNLLDRISLLEKRLSEVTAQVEKSKVERNQDSLHILLLLADSALPLGSFAFSSGLESYLSHPRPSLTSQIAAFQSFLRLSLSSLAGTSLPYLVEAYKSPKRIFALDNDFDASTPCTVARRASAAQGRALLSLWNRSFRKRYGSASDVETVTALATLNRFMTSLRKNDSKATFQVNAHLAPVWGLVSFVLNFPLHDSTYLFLFSHARNIANAGVRAGVIGPYLAQALLASIELQTLASNLLREHWEKKVEDAGQNVPVMDIWVGRHEKLYSRIFNS